MLSEISRQIYLSYSDSDDSVMSVLIQVDEIHRIMHMDSVRVWRSIFRMISIRLDWRQSELGSDDSSRKKRSTYEHSRSSSRIRHLSKMLQRRSSV